jgi:hypothetical protein
MACNNKQYQPAEDALDAAREFKSACLTGDFQKAKFYIKSTEKNTAVLDEMIKQYQTNDAEQKRELKDASLRVISSKEIDSFLYQIILSNSFDKRADTFFSVKENVSWLVDLKH